MNGGEVAEISTSRGRTTSPRPSASSLGSGHIRSRAPARTYEAWEPWEAKTTGRPPRVAISPKAQRSAPECWA